MTEEHLPALIGAQMLCLLDDAARRAVEHGPIAVLLDGSLRSAATLGLVSLYHDGPVFTYAASANPLIMQAARRFGALHRPVAATAAVNSIGASEGLIVLNGSNAGPGPFADKNVQLLLATFNCRQQQEEAIALALRPLLGTALLEGKAGIR